MENAVQAKTFNVLELSSQSQAGNNELRLWFNGADTYVAKSIEHARKLMLAHLGEGSGDDVPPADEWNEDTRESLTIGDDELGPRTKTRKEWIAENGEGFLCSTEW